MCVAFLLCQNNELGHWCVAGLNGLSMLDVNLRFWCCAHAVQLLQGWALNPALSTTCLGLVILSLDFHAVLKYPVKKCFGAFKHVVSKSSRIEIKTLFQFTLFVLLQLFLSFFSNSLYKPYHSTAPSSLEISLKWCAILSSRFCHVACCLKQAGCQSAQQTKYYSYKLPILVSAWLFYHMHWLVYL